MLTSAFALARLVALATLFMGILFPNLSTLHPKRDVLAATFANVLASESPLFADDASRERTLALVLAVSYRESGFNPRAVGDNGHSFGLMQINDSMGGSKAMLDDPASNIRRGLDMLRTSLKACPDHPVAWYAAGPRACESERAKRISRDRVWLAKDTLKKAKALLAAQEAEAAPGL